jgi:hypothetical protein
VRGNPGEKSTIESIQALEKGWSTLMKNNIANSHKDNSFVLRQNESAVEVK